MSKPLPQFTHYSLLPSDDARISGLLKSFVGLVLACSSTMVLAQLNGHNSKGDYGLMSGTQPEPGFYATAPFAVFYESDTLRDADGGNLTPGPDASTIRYDAYSIGGWWITEYKLFGGNYSFGIYPSLSNNAVEAPALLAQSSSKTSTGLSDLYIQPIALGWHNERFDSIAGVGIYAPTGEYEFGADDNRGLGMWSFEIYAGGTFYFDEAKSWHLATTAFYETHSDKADTDIRAGDILTIEGGLGKSWMGGGISAGLAYYAQWKVTRDDLEGIDDLIPGMQDIELDKHRIFGFGPEVSVALASRSKLYGFLSLRYMWETGVESNLEGESLMATLTIPIPSITF